MRTLICACGCGGTVYATRSRTKYLRGHYEASAAGKATQAKGGRQRALLAQGRRTDFVGLDLAKATDLERGLYNLCQEVERLPASAFQTRLVMAMSDAMHELWRLRHSAANVAAQGRRAAQTLERRV